MGLVATLGDIALSTPPQPARVVLRPCDGRKGEEEWGERAAEVGVEERKADLCDRLIAVEVGGRGGGKSLSPPPFSLSSCPT